MSEKKTVCVLGAGGKTGKECVKELLKQGFAVRAVVRSPPKYKEEFESISRNSRIEGSLDLISGDVTQPDSLSSALDNSDGGVIFAVSGSTYMSADSVDHKGVVNVINYIKSSSKDSPSGRIVLISSCLVTPHNRFHPLRILLNNIRWGLMDAKYRGEEALRKSGLDYCIVRPGGLTDKAQGEHTLVVGQGDTQSGMVPRSDVAAVCVSALTDPNASKTTFELVTEKKKEEGVDIMPLRDQLKSLFLSLHRDE